MNSMQPVISFLFLLSQVAFIQSADIAARQPSRWSSQPTNIVSVLDGKLAEQIAKPLHNCFYFI